MHFFCVGPKHLCLYLSLNNPGIMVKGNCASSSPATETIREILKDF